MKKGKTVGEVRQTMSSNKNKKGFIKKGQECKHTGGKEIQRRGRIRRRKYKRDC